MKTILATLFSLMSFFAISQTNDQFRLVGSGTWSTINDSTYQASLSFMSDLSGGGFLATDIVDSFRLFTGIEKIYRVDTVWNKTFSSASVRVVEYNGTSGIPSGQVMIYNPDGRSTIPQVPFGSTGATAQLQAAVVTYNGKQTATGSGITDGDKGGIDVSASGATWTVDTFAVGTIQIAGDAVTASQIAADAVGSSEIAANAVGSSEIAADAVGNSEMADNAVGSAEIIAESIAAVDIDTGAVTTSEILDGAVAWGDLSGAVQDSIRYISDIRDTITQTAHGFRKMDAVLDTAATSAPKFIRGNTSSSSKLPSHIVVDSLSANQFVIQRGGYFKGYQTRYNTRQVYYLQDDGSYGATPDATFNFPVFGITSTTTPIYLNLLPGSVSPTTADSLWELSDQTIFGASEKVLKLSTVRTSGSYNQHLLLGSPTVDIPGTDGASENEYSRLIYFNQDRAFFLAGRVNTITDIDNSSVKQWDGGRVAQYSASFGWNNYAYGGYSSINGALGKGQTMGGYQNRSLDAYAQTWGQNNINGSFKGTVLGDQNVIGRTMYDFSRYDTTTSTAYVKTNVASLFAVNTLVVSRTYDAANSYYVPAHARVTAVSYNGGTDSTAITFDRKYFNITDYFQSSGQLIRGEPGVGTYSNHARGALNYISGATNVVDGVSNTVMGERNYVTGKSNTVSGNDSHADCSTCEVTVNNSWAFGSQVKNDITTSIAYAMGGFSSVRGTAQTFIVPSKLDFTTSGNIDIPMPDSSTWTVRADFALGEYSAGNQRGGFSLFFTCYRDGTGNTTILGSPTTTYTAGTPGTWTASVSGSTTNLRISLAVDSGKTVKVYGSVNIQQVIE